MKTKTIPTQISDAFEPIKFSVNTPAFMKEVIENSGSRMYRVCFNIFAGLLKDVAIRATELHDPVLDALMLRLGMYEVDYRKRPGLIEKCREIYEEQLKTK